MSDVAIAQHPVSVVIPTYNGIQLLQKNLPAVVAAVRPEDELIIMDDFSTDGSVEWLQQEFIPNCPCSARVYVNERNLRFAASVNRGVRHAQHQYIFLLNNDVSPHPNVLQPLLNHFTNPTVFAVGCREIEPGEVVSGKNNLWFERGMFMHSRADNLDAGETAWASGGSAMFDRSKWLELGGFDIAYYPAYWEDIDLSFRARQQGWLILFEPKAVVEHNHETTNHDEFGSQKIAAISWRNANTFTWKNGSWWQRLQWLIWRPYWWWRRSKIGN